MSEDPGPRKKVNPLEDITLCDELISADAAPLPKDVNEGGKDVPPTKKVKRKKRIAKAKVPDRAMPFALDIPEFNTRLKRKRMVRLPPSKLPDDADAEDAGFCKTHWKQIVTMASLIGIVAGGYLLCTGNGPLAQMFRTLVEQTVEIFGFKEVAANDTDAFGWNYIEVTERGTIAPITLEPTIHNDTAEWTTRKPLKRRPPPEQAVATANTTFKGNVYYFYHFPYKSENAMKICYERHNKARLLYVADKSETASIVDWYYKNIYNEIKSPYQMDISYIWTGGMIDYRKDYKTATPLHKMNPNDLKKSNRWKWLGANGDKVVSMQNAITALCEKWQPSELGDHWKEFLDAEKELLKSTNPEDVLEFKNAVENLVFFGVMNMQRLTEVDTSAGCIRWLWAADPKHRKQMKFPFVCKRMTTGNFPDDEIYRKNYINTDWIIDE